MLAMSLEREELPVKIEAIDYLQISIALSPLFLVANGKSVEKYLRLGW
jgi:hypothetical protein